MPDPSVTPRRSRIRMRAVLVLALLLVLSVSGVFYLLEETSDLAALDGALLLQQLHASRRSRPNSRLSDSDAVVTTVGVTAMTVTAGEEEEEMEITAADVVFGEVTAATDYNNHTNNSALLLSNNATVAMTTPPLSCAERPLPVAQLCSLSSHQTASYLGPGVLLGELADSFFSTIALDALVTRCSNATWCLGYDLDKDLLLGDSMLYMDYCDLGGCLQEIPEECVTPTRLLTVSTLRLLCDARMRNVSDRCILGIKKMTHVALVGEVLTVNETGPNCSINTSGECTEGCVQLAQQISAMWAACSEEIDSNPFRRYGQWQWVFDSAMMDNSTDICNRNNTQWPSFSDSTVLELKVFQQMLYHIQQNGMAVLAGIVTAFIVTVAGFGIIFWACAKKVYAFYEYSRDRVEYTEVKDSHEARIAGDFESADDEEEDEVVP